MITIYPQMVNNSGSMNNVQQKNVYNNNVNMHKAKDISFGDSSSKHYNLQSTILHKMSNFHVEEDTPSKAFTAFHKFIADDLAYENSHKFPGDEVVPLKVPQSKFVTAMTALYNDLIAFKVSDIDCAIDNQLVNKMGIKKPGFLDSIFGSSECQEYNELKILMRNAYRKLGKSIIIK